MLPTARGRSGVHCGAKASGNTAELHSLCWKDSTVGQAQASLPIDRGLVGEDLSHASLAAEGPGMSVSPAMLQEVDADHACRVQPNFPLHRIVSK